MRSSFIALTAMTRLFVVGALFLSAGCVPSPRTTTSGDATIRDGGAFYASFPRYRIEFPEVALESRSTHVFRFAEMPGDDMSFQLYLRSEVLGQENLALGYDYFTNEGASALGRLVDAEVERLYESQTRIEVHIETEDGRRVASASGGLGMDSWIIAYGVSMQSIWHPSLRDLNFRRHENYRLIIKISDYNLASQIFVTPTFEGGGWESI